MHAIGLVANPASGKDIRRLAGKASVFDNREKLAIVKRAVTGAIATGAQRFVYMSDSHGIVSEAIKTIRVPRHVRFEALPSPKTSSAMDTTAAAEQMATKDCAVVLVLGGDGTNRAFVKGWRDATLVSLSTGTNNVFPVMAEATVAGMVLGLMATGNLKTRSVARRVKIIDVLIDAEAADLALIDAVATSDTFIGARALLEPDRLREALLCRAEPAAVGMTSLGGLIRPVVDGDDFGLHLVFSKGGRCLKAPIGPGLFATLNVGSTRKVGFDRSIVLEGPLVLAFDGERERMVGVNQTVKMMISRTGPWVVDLNQAMQLCAKKKLLLESNP